MDIKNINIYKIDSKSEQSNHFTHEALYSTYIFRCPFRAILCGCEWIIQG